MACDEQGNIGKPSRPKPPLPCASHALPGIRPSEAHSCESGSWSFIPDGTLAKTRVQSSHCAQKCTAQKGELLWLRTHSESVTGPAENPGSPTLVSVLLFWSLVGGVGWQTAGTTGGDSLGAQLSLLECVDARSPGRETGGLVLTGHPGASSNRPTPWQAVALVWGSTPNPSGGGGLCGGTPSPTRLGQALAELQPGISLGSSEQRGPLLSPDGTALCCPPLP